jgi:hypothetical protein
MRAIAPGIPPHVCPRQGRRRPMPRVYAAGEVTDFTLLTFYDISHGYICPRQGPPEARADFLCCR